MSTIGTRSARAVHIHCPSAMVQVGVSPPSCSHGVQGHCNLGPHRCEPRGPASRPVLPRFNSWYLLAYDDPISGTIPVYADLSQSGWGKSGVGRVDPTAENLTVDTASALLPDSPSRALRRRKGLAGPRFVPWGCRGFDLNVTKIPAGNAGAPTAMPEVPPGILRSDRIEGFSVYPLRRLAGAQIRAVTVP